MKKIATLVIMLLSSLILNAQRYCVTLWGNQETFNLQKKKNSADSILFLAKGPNPETYLLIEKGKTIDILSQQYLYVGQKQISIDKEKGKYYLNGYRIMMDSTLNEEMNSKVHRHYSHSSHSSHVSHYSSRL